MVVWSDYLNAIAAAFGTSAVEAGIIFSLSFTILGLMVVLIATKGKSPQSTVPFMTLFMTIFFTFLGWYPIWVGSVLSLVISILLAYILSRS